MLAANLKRRFPFCICCWNIGVRSPTKVIDHIMPLVDAPDRLLDPTNLQPLCQFCHDVVKREVERLWRIGKVKASDLDMRSDVAYALRRKLHRPWTGVDGLPIDEMI